MTAPTTWEDFPMKISLIESPSNWAENWEQTTGRILSLNFWFHETNTCADLDWRSEPEIPQAAWLTSRSLSSSAHRHHGARNWQECFKRLWSMQWGGRGRSKMIEPRKGQQSKEVKYAPMVTWSSPFLNTALNYLKKSGWSMLSFLGNYIWIYQSQWRGIIIYTRFYSSVCI